MIGGKKVDVTVYHVNKWVRQPLRIVELVVLVAVIAYVYHFVQKMDCELVARYDRVNPYVELVLVVLLVTFVGNFSPLLALLLTVAYVATIFRYYKVCGGRQGVYYPLEKTATDAVDKVEDVADKIGDKIEHTIDKFENDDEPAGVDRYGYGCVKGCCGISGGGAQCTGSSDAQGFACPINGFENVDRLGAPLE